MQLMRYYVDGTIDLQGSYVGYLLQGSAVNHRINENSESLYDPYINAAGSLSTDSSTYGQRILFQVWKVLVWYLITSNLNLVYMKG